MSHKGTWFYLLPKNLFLSSITSSITQGDWSIGWENTARDYSYTIPMASHTHTRTPTLPRTHNTHTRALPHTHTHTQVPAIGLPPPRLRGGGECVGVERTKGPLPLSTVPAAPVEGGSIRVGVWPTLVCVGGHCLGVLKLISLLTWSDNSTS